MKITLPAQTVPVDTPVGVDPIWYEKLQQMAQFVDLFSAVDFRTLSTGQTIVWNADLKKFIPGAS